MVLLNPMKMMCQCYQSMLQMEHPTNIPYVELDDAPVASDSASVADPYNPDEPDPEHLRQSKQTWECQYSHLRRINKVTYTFGPKQIPICAT